jgi:glycosyltransferase involved in cell wall biosynthesis
LVKHSDPSRVEWTGVAVSGFGGCDRGLAMELGKYVPLFTNTLPIGCKSRYPFQWPTAGYKTGVDFRETIKEAARGADVLLTWGTPCMGYWFDQFEIPRIVCSHTTQSEPFPLASITGVTHLVGVSEAALRYFDHRGDVELPMTVIYNGADPERCQTTWTRRELRETHDLKNDDLVVGYIGRQSPEKNHLAAARAVNSLPLNYRALYYGVGPKGNGFCKDLVAYCEQNIPGRFGIYEARADIGNVLGCCDVLMLASHREAFSLTLIEAWLAGVPVIATPVGCLPELEAKYGPLTFQVPLDPCDTVLQKAVKVVCNAHGLRRQIVSHARQIARREFTIQAMAARWATYLEDVVAGRI